jgi:hypothetical protein
MLRLLIALLFALAPLLFASAPLLIALLFALAPLQSTHKVAVNAFEQLSTMDVLFVELEVLMMNSRGKRMESVGGDTRL